MANIKSVKALTGCTAGLQVTEDFSKASRYMVEYESGNTKFYPADKLPKTVQAWLDEHKPAAEDPAEEEAQNPLEQARRKQEEETQIPGQMELTDFIPDPSDQLPAVRTSQDLLNEFPNTSPKLSLLACLQLSALFMAATAVFMAWWLVRAILAAYVATEAVRRTGRRIRAWIREAWAFRFEVIMEGVM